jgi:hypothetical protein
MRERAVELLQHITPPAALLIRPDGSLADEQPPGAAGAGAGAAKVVGSSSGGGASVAAAASITGSWAGGGGPVGVSSSHAGGGGGGGGDTRAMAESRERFWDEVGRALKCVDRSLLEAWATWSAGFRSPGLCKDVWFSFPPVACDVHSSVASAVRDSFLKLLHKRGGNYRAALDRVLTRAWRRQQVRSLAARRLSCCGAGGVVWW